MDRPSNHSNARLENEENGEEQNEKNDEEHYEALERHLTATIPLLESRA